MQILEHQQHGCGSGTLAEQHQRRLEQPPLRTPRRFVDPPGIAERSQGLDERLIRQLRADKINRTPEEDLEPGGAGPSRKLGRQPGFAHSRVSRNEDGRTAPGPRRIERAPELPELAYAAYETLARPSRHSGQYRAADPRLAGHR
jgi:hypothetical protein